MVANLHIFSLLKEDSQIDDLSNPPRLITGTHHVASIVVAH